MNFETKTLEYLSIHTRRMLPAQPSPSAAPMAVVLPPPMGFEVPTVQHRLDVRWNYCFFKSIQHPQGRRRYTAKCIYCGLEQEGRPERMERHALVTCHRIPSEVKRQYKQDIERSASTAVSNEGRSGMKRTHEDMDLDSNPAALDGLLSLRRQGHAFQDQEIGSTEGHEEMHGAISASNPSSSSKQSAVSVRLRPLHAFRQLWHASLQSRSRSIAEEALYLCARQQIAPAQLLTSLESILSLSRLSSHSAAAHYPAWHLAGFTSADDLLSETLPSLHKSVLATMTRAVGMMRGLSRSLVVQFAVQRGRIVLLIAVSTWCGLVVLHRSTCSSLGDIDGVLQSCGSLWSKDPRTLIDSVQVQVDSVNLLRHHLLPRTLQHLSAVFHSTPTTTGNAGSFQPIVLPSLLSLLQRVVLSLLKSCLPLTWLRSDVLPILRQLCHHPLLDHSNGQMAFEQWQKANPQHHRLLSVCHQLSRPHSCSTLAQLLYTYLLIYITIEVMAVKYDHSGDESTKAAADIVKERAELWRRVKDTVSVLCPLAEWLALVHQSSLLHRAPLSIAVTFPTLLHLSKVVTHDALNPLELRTVYLQEFNRSVSFLEPDSSFPRHNNSNNNSNSNSSVSADTNWLSPVHLASFAFSLCPQYRSVALSRRWTATDLHRIAVALMQRYPENLQRLVDVHTSTASAPQERKRTLKIAELSAESVSEQLWLGLQHYLALPIHTPSSSEAADTNASPFALMAHVGQVESVLSWWVPHITSAQSPLRLLSVVATYTLTLSFDPLPVSAAIRHVDPTAAQNASSIAVADQLAVIGHGLSPVCTADLPPLPQTASASDSASSWTALLHEASDAELWLQCEQDLLVAEQWSEAQQSVSVTTAAERSSDGLTLLTLDQLFSLKSFIEAERRPPTPIEHQQHTDSATAVHSVAVGPDSDDQFPGVGVHTLFAGAGLMAPGDLPTGTSDDFGSEEDLNFTSVATQTTWDEWDAAVFLAAYQQYEETSR